MLTVSQLFYSFLFFISPNDAKYAFMLSAVGHFSLFPLLFHIDLLVIRYSLYLAYMGYMYIRYVAIHKDYPDMNLLEDCYIHGLLLIPVYEHLIGWLTGLNKKYPFLPLLLYSSYCAVGILYCYIRYYIFALNLKTIPTVKTKKSKAKKIKNAKTFPANSSEPSKSESLPLTAKMKGKERNSKEAQRKKHK